MGCEVNRAAYEADRAWTRRNRATREDQGLPHHPDGTGWATCPDCGGDGIAETVNDSAIGDPAFERDVGCERCYREGMVPDGHEDPFWAMRRNRTRMRQSWRLSPGFASTLYRLDRATAMKPVTLPHDYYADPLFRQAKRDCDAAIQSFQPINALFDQMFGRAA